VSQINILSQNLTLFIILTFSIFFVLIGIIYSKKHKGLNNYLIANRDVGTLSITTSLVASSLGAWILFGPASAATWGGIGVVIGYSLGAAFPMLALIFFGVKIRNIFPKGKTLIQFIRIKYGKNLFKLILILTIFYMFIFLSAEVTAIAILVKYISGTPLWITSIIVIITTLTYTLYGGLRASIFTDNIQFFIIIFLFLIGLNYLLFFTDDFSLEIIKKNSPHLLSANYIPNFTAGLTFFIAVSATNLFHQGNWQRVFAAKNNKVLKKSLLISFFIIIPIVFFMGFTGMIAKSQNINTNPDLAFFSVLLKDQTRILSLMVISLAISLTISTADTLINAITSLVIVDGKNILKLSKKNNFFKFSKYIIIFLSLISFIIASKGFSILYLFLLADLLCCAAVITVFYGFYQKNINENDAIFAILIGLFLGLLFFPSPDFSKSILVGIFFSYDIFPKIVSSFLLFWSFFIATLGPAIVIMIYDSFKGR